MNQYHRDARRRIKDAVRVWGNLVPPGVTVHHLFIEGTVDTESPDVIAETKTAWEYHQATIRWSLVNAAPLSDDELEETLVHELVHVMLAPIELPHRTDDDTPMNAVCEYTVSTVARAILRLVP